MSFNGSGTFLINTAGQPVVAGTVISSTAFNALTADLATGLSTAITKDGQTTVTANIPMSTYKFTGLGVGSAATDSANLSQVQSTVTKLLTSVSGADTITAVGAPVVAAYAAGQMFYFVATGDNTGAVTLNIDSLGAKAVTRDGSVALAAGDIKSGEVVVVVYDGTRFQVVSQLNSAGNATFANVSITSALNVGGVATFSAGTAAAPSITTTGDTNTGIFFPAADTIAFTEGGVEAMRIDSSGQVGIGTSSPAYKLDVRGSGNIISWSDGTTPGVLYSAASYFGLTNSAQTNGFFVNPSGAFCTIATGGSERARIDSSGNLGIGTSSPTEKLHVAGALRVTGAQTTAGTGVYLDQTSGTGGVSVYGPDNSTQGTFRIYTATANGGTGSTKLTLDTSGNLGLGVTPSAWSSSFGIKAFDISGGAVYGSSSDVNMVWNGVYNTSNQWAYKASATANLYTQDGAHKWFSAASGTAGNAISFTQAMTLDASANLSVGTTAVTTAGAGYQAFTINGANGSNIALNGGATNIGLIYAATGNSNLYIGNQTASGNLIFNAGSGTERARITAAGDLLVGTTSTLNSNVGLSVQGSQTNGGAGVITAYNSAAASADNSPPLVVMKAMTTTTSAARFVQFYANDTAQAMGGIVGNGATNVQFATISDCRNKTNIEEIAGSLDKVLALKPVSFDWVANGEHVKAGFVAQDVEEIFPEFVVENMADEGAEARKGLTGGMTGGIIAHLVKAIQEQQAMIKSLEAKVAALESK